MKFRLFLLLLLFNPSFIHAQNFSTSGYFVIKGQVKNFKDQLFDVYMTTYFDNTSNSVRVKPDGSFEQQFPVQFRQDISFVLNNNVIRFTIMDKDTLNLEWDDTDFIKTFSVKGKKELRTKELQQQLKEYTIFSKPLVHLHNYLYEKRDELTLENKFNLINDLYNRNVKAIFDSAGVLSKNTNNHFTDLYFQYTNILWFQGLIPQYKLKLSLNSSGKSYTYFDMAEISLDYTELNEAWFWNVPAYRYFIFNYIRFYQPFKYVKSSTSIEEPFNPTLHEYYTAQSNIYLTNIKDWFIAKSIMTGFGHYTFTDVEKVYTQFINTCTTPYVIDTLKNYYTATKRLKPESPAPIFSLQNEKGQKVSLSEFKGKVVYIDFWGIGCGSCIHDIKNYVPKLHDHYKDKNVVFINICVDSKELEWKKALENYKLDGINLIAEGWTQHPVCKSYNVSGLPHYFLVDKNGKIANNNAPRANGFNLESGNNEIDLLLK